MRSHPGLLGWFAIAGVLGAVGTGWTDGGRPRPSAPLLEPGRPVKPAALRAADATTKAKAQESRPATDLVAFRPPLRGAPVGRISGGTRGVGDSVPMLCVLTPDHTGLTTREQPALRWFLSEVPPYPVEFTLMEEDGVAPLLEVPLPTPSRAGYQVVRLQDLGVRLETGTVYRWYIAVVPDPDRRSKDQVAWGAVERVPTPESLSAELAGAEPAQLPGIYARAGLWYDALDALSDLADDAPQPEPYLEQRAALLEQVGLSAVVAAAQR